LKLPKSISAHHLFGWIQAKDLSVRMRHKLYSMSFIEGEIRQGRASASPGREARQAYPNGESLSEKTDERK